MQSNDSIFLVISGPVTQEQIQSMLGVNSKKSTSFQGTSIYHIALSEDETVATGDLRDWCSILFEKEAELEHIIGMYYPNPRPDDLMVWYLWSCNREGKPQGVYSHDTALELLELSTWTSARIHMTVPKDFRRSKIPPTLHLHYADLRQFETTVIRQVPVTKPIRTILDLNAEKKIQHHHLIEAMQDAHKSGLIIPNELNSEWLTDEEKRTLRAIDSEAAKYTPEA